MPQKFHLSCCCAGMRLLPNLPSMQPSPLKSQYLHRLARWIVTCFIPFVATADVIHTPSSFCRLLHVHFSKLHSKLRILVRPCRSQILVMKLKSSSLASNQTLITCTGQWTEVLLSSQRTVVCFTLWSGSSTTFYSFLLLEVAHKITLQNMNVVEWLNRPIRNDNLVRTMRSAIFRWSYSGWTCAGDAFGTAWRFLGFLPITEIHDFAACPFLRHQCRS